MNLVIKIKCSSPWGLKAICFLWVMLGSVSVVCAQTQLYWVTFTDKQGSENPYYYYAPEALERRSCQYNHPFNPQSPPDSNDFAVSPAYLAFAVSCIDEKTNTNAEAFHTIPQIVACSRWFNGVGLYLEPHRAEELKKQAFVKNIELKTEKNGCSFAAAYLENDSKQTPSTLTTNEIQLLEYQTRRLQGDLFAQAGLDGKGVKIAVFDIGFANANKAPELEHLFTSGRIVETKDFVTKKPISYKQIGEHGTQTLSNIAGIYTQEGKTYPMGLATGAQFYLARTERVTSELFAEELRWLAAAEWADEKGVSIINSSLGYTNPRYTYLQMDGKTAFISRAANRTASKGILVVNSAGNEGDEEFEFVAAPADADSVLTIGGTNPYSDMHIKFSSFGPTKDGRLKPNVAAPGYTITRGSKNTKTASGTSFSAPLVAGFAGCLKQKYPNYSERQLFEAIQKAGHLYPYYDYAHGFGVPQASRALTPDAQPVSRNFKISTEAGQIIVTLNQKPAQGTTHNLYYHIIRPNGIIVKYGVVKAESVFAFTIDKVELNSDENCTLRIHYEGFTDTIDTKTLYPK